MTRAIRWRVIVLQVVAVLVLAFGSGAAFYASSFTNTQIQPARPAADLLPRQRQGWPARRPQPVCRPAGAHRRPGACLRRQVHRPAPERDWSGSPVFVLEHPGAIATDPTVAAKDQAIADTLFKGETLRSMLNQAWTFSVMAQIAFYAAIGMAIAAVIVLGTLIFEVAELVTGREEILAARLPATAATPELADAL